MSGLRLLIDFRFKGNENERIVDNRLQWRTPRGTLCGYPQSPSGTSGPIPVAAVFKAPLKTLLQRKAGGRVALARQLRQGWEPAAQPIGIGGVFPEWYTRGRVLSEAKMYPVTSSK